MTVSRSSKIQVFNPDDFEEYPVIRKKMTQLYETSYSTIDIQPIKKDPRTDDIPKDPIFTKEYLIRFNSILEEKGYFARGDTRSPEEMGSEIVPKCKAPNTTPHYNIYEHRLDSDCSGFVSLTDKMDVAHEFGQHYEDEAVHPGYYIYVAEMDRGLWMFEGPYPSESEHSAIGSVPIVSYRECFSKDQPYTQCNNIFIKKNLPDAIKQKILEAQLLPSEKLNSRSIPDVKHETRREAILKQKSYEYWQKNEKSKKLNTNLKSIPKILGDEKLTSTSREALQWEQLVKNARTKNAERYSQSPPMDYIKQKTADLTQGKDYFSLLQNISNLTENKNNSSYLCNEIIFPSTHNTESVVLLRKLIPSQSLSLDQHSDYLLEQIRKHTGQALSPNFMKTTAFQNVLNQTRVEHGLSREQTHLLALYASGRFAENKPSFNITKPDPAFLKSSVEMLQVTLKADLNKKASDSAIFQLVSQTSAKMGELKRSDWSLEKVRMGQYQLSAVSDFCSNIARLSGAPVLARRLNAISHSATQWMGGVSALTMGHPIMGIMGIGNALFSLVGGFFDDDDDDNNGMSVISGQISQLNQSMIEGFNLVLSQQLDIGRELSRQILSTHQQTMGRFDRVDYNLSIIQQQIVRTYEALSIQNHHISQQIISVSHQLTEVELRILKQLQTVHTDFIQYLQTVGESIQKGLIQIDSNLRLGLTHLNHTLQVQHRETQIQLAEHMRLSNFYFDNLMQSQKKQLKELDRQASRLSTLEQEFLLSKYQHYDELRERIEKELTKSAEYILMTENLEDQFFLEKIMDVKYCLNETKTSKLTAKIEEKDAKSVLSYIGLHANWGNLNPFNIINLLTTKEKSPPLVHLQTHQRNLLAYIKWLQLKDKIPEEQINFVKAEVQKIREIEIFCQYLAKPEVIKVDFQNISDSAVKVADILKKQLLSHQDSLMQELQKRLRNALVEHENFKVPYKNGSAKEISDQYADRLKDNLKIDLLDEKIIIKHDRPIAYFAYPVADDKSSYLLPINVDNIPTLPQEILALEALGKGWIQFDYQFDVEKKKLTFNVKFHAYEVNQTLLLSTTTLFVASESEIEKTWQQFKWVDRTPLKLEEKDEQVIHTLHAECLTQTKLQLNKQLQDDLQSPEIEKTLENLDANVGLFNAKCKLIFENSYLSHNKTLFEILNSCLTSKKLINVLHNYNGKGVHPIFDLLDCKDWYLELEKQLNQAILKQILNVDNMTLTNALLLLDNMIFTLIGPQQKIAYCDEILKTLPEASKETLLYLRGTLFATEEKDLLKALTDFKKALEFRPDDSIIRLAYADCLVARGQTIDAIQQYDILIENLQTQFTARGKKDLLTDKNINLGLLYLSRGNTHLANNDIGAAFGDYDQASLLLPDQPEVLAKHGQCLQLFNQFELAIDDYKKTLLIDKNHYPSILGMAICLFKLNKKIEAFTWFEQVLKIPTDSIQLKLYAAECCPLDNDKAIEWLKAVSDASVASIDDKLRCAELFLERNLISLAALTYEKIKNQVTELTQFERCATLCFKLQNSREFAINKQKALLYSNKLLLNKSGLFATKPVLGKNQNCSLQTSPPLSSTFTK